jgi:hypothetical protein
MSVSNVVLFPGALARAQQTTPLRRIDVTRKPYGADSSGKSDTTEKIRSAVSAACAAGGARLYFPTGTYKVAIQFANEIAAIPIGCDNVTIEGDGKDRSVISVLAYGDANPDTTCPVFKTSDGQLTMSKVQRNMWVYTGDISVVNRGSGFFVYGKRSNIHFKDIRITGNRETFANMNGDGDAVPATEANCFNAWDITDKGIYFQQDLPHNNCSLENIRLDHWSGEMFYFGYGDTRRLGGLITITDSEFDHGTSDGISMSTQLIATGNNFNELGAQAIENSSYAEKQLIQHNTVTNSARGITIINFPWEQKGGAFDVSNNTLTNIAKTGIMIGAQNAHVHDNAVTDFSYQKNGLWAGIGIFNDTKGYCPSTPEVCKAKNIEIDHNTFYADKKTSGPAIVAVAGDYPSADNVMIHDNTARLTPFALAHSISMEKGVGIFGEIKNLQEYNNVAVGTVYNRTDNMVATNVKIGKEPTTVVKFRPVRLREFTIQATTTVSSSATVSATLLWFDSSGAQRSRPVLSATTYRPGRYAFPPLKIVAQGATESQYIKLVVRADKSNSVTTSAVIQESN